MSPVFVSLFPKELKKTAAFKVLEDRRMILFAYHLPFCDDCFKKRIVDFWMLFHSGETLCRASCRLRVYFL